MLHEYRVMYRDENGNLDAAMLSGESVTQLMSKLKESEEFIIESISLSRSDIENVDNA